MPDWPKISAPALAACVVPTRLQAQMGNIDKYCAHWIHAGPGAGKTQGIRLWLKQKNRPYAWIQLDSLDNDPILLLEHLRSALLPLLPEGARLPHFIAHGAVSLDRHCEYLWECFFGQLERSAILVLDDAHHIACWVSHPVLGRLLLDLDSRLHVVVISRQILPEAYAREVINRRIQLVQAEAFVLDQEHLKDWLARRWGIKRVPAEMLSRLLELSQGWAAVLGLLNMKVLSRDPEALEQEALNQLELVSLIESSVLHDLGPAEIMTLRWLTCLSSFPEHWLFQLDLPPMVKHHVKRWSQESSVVTKLEGTQGELRFHPLFAELLRNVSIDPQPHLEAFRRRLIDVCLDAGRIQDGLELCRDHQDWERYWEILKWEGLSWIEQGQVGRLAQAIFCIPEQTREQLEGPTFALLLAAASIHTDPVLAYTSGLRAIAACQPAQEHSRIWAMSLSTATNAVVAAGLSFDKFAPILDEIATHIHTPWFEHLRPEIKLQALWAATAASIWGRNRLDLKTLHDQIQRMLPLCTNVDLTASIISAAMRLFAVPGISEYVASTYQQVKRIEHEVETPAAKLALLHAHWNLYFSLGEKEKAYNYAHASMEYSSSNTLFPWQIEAMATATFCSASIGNLDLTRRASEQIVKVTNSLPGTMVGLRTHCSLYQGCIALHDGDATSARVHFETATQHSDDFIYPLMQTVTRSGLLVSFLELNETVRARELITQTEEILEEHNIPVANRSLLGMKALLAIHEGDEPEANALVQKTFQAMHESDSYLLSLDMFPQSRNLLTYALEHGIEPESAETFIRRAPLFPESRPHPKWPSFFEVEVLGGFSLKINGRQARSRFMSSGRRFELLTALLWVGGNELSYQDCFTWIWPYIDEKRQTRAMKQALKRLLADLEHNQAILATSTGLSLNPELWSYDAWDLNALLCRQAGPSIPEGLHDSTLQVPIGSASDRIPEFVGPTPIPVAMQDQVPQSGAITLGPRPLLTYFPDAHRL